MMNVKEIRKTMRAQIISAPSFHNGYARELGILDRYSSVQDSNLYALEGFLKKLKKTEELIEEYERKGNDLNSEVAFQDLRNEVELIFKSRGFFSFFK